MYMRSLPLIICCCSAVHAQNLVVNPGFEECAVRDSLHSQWNIISSEDLDLNGWNMPSTGTSDHYYVAENDSSLRVHSCPRPIEGHCASGFIAMTGYYEYVQGSLSEPLKRGVLYHFSFLVATEDNADFREGRIGISFSEQPRSQTGSYLMRLKPDISLDTIADRRIHGDWLVYNTWYEAKGGENFFVVGEFIAADKFPNGEDDAWYFFVDDFYLGTEEDPDLPVMDTAPTAVTEVITPVATITAGQTLTLSNIYFETGKSRILPQSFLPLDTVIAEMKEQPQLRVEIIGHTDKHGDNVTNQKLSEDRAKSVADYFVSSGIDPSRITTSGKGSSEPISEEDARNRRVEFRFTQ